MHINKSKIINMLINTVQNELKISMITPSYLLFDLSNLILANVHIFFQQCKHFISYQIYPAFLANPSTYSKKVLCSLPENEASSYALI